MSTKVTIDRDGIWAGTGIWTGDEIVDCDAVLGADQDASDETYEALADELACGGVAVSVDRPDGRYTAELLDE